MKNLFYRYVRDMRGATAIEYGILVASIGIGISIMAFSFGDSIGIILQNIATDLTDRVS